MTTEATALDRVLARARQAAPPPAMAPVAAPPVPTAPADPTTDQRVTDLEELVAELVSRVETLEEAAVSDAMDEYGDLAPVSMPAAIVEQFGDLEEPPPFPAAATPTKSEGDAGNFPAGDYAYVPDPSKPSTWKLRLTATPGGKPDANMVGAAAAALGPGFRGNKADIPQADRAGVIAKVRSAWKTANPDAKPADMPDVLKP